MARKKQVGYVIVVEEDRDLRETLNAHCGVCISLESALAEARKLYSPGGIGLLDGDEYESERVLPILILKINGWETSIVKRIKPRDLE